MCTCFVKKKQFSSVGNSSRVFLEKGLFAIVAIVEMVAIIAIAATTAAIETIAKRQFRKKHIGIPESVAENLAVKFYTSCCQLICSRVSQGVVHLLSLKCDSLTLCSTQVASVEVDFVKSRLQAKNPPSSPRSLSMLDIRP